MWISLLAQRVKDTVLSLRWLRLLLWFSFDPWPRNFHILKTRSLPNDIRRGEFSPLGNHPWGQLVPSFISLQTGAALRGLRKSLEHPQRSLNKWCIYYNYVVMIRKNKTEAIKKNIEFSLWLSMLRTGHRVLEDAGLIPGSTQWVKDPVLPWAMV